MEPEDDQNPSNKDIQPEPSKKPSDTNKKIVLSPRPRKYIDSLHRIQRELMDERYRKRRKKVDQRLYMKNCEEGELGEKPSDPIVQFYRGQIGDHLGRKLDEILLWDNERLEYTHDYIQWLFPLKSRSPVNPEAPILDENQIKTFEEDPKLRARLEEAFGKMLSFYGLDLIIESAAITIGLAKNWNQRKRVWLNRGNHNYKRITRILSSLKILGLPEYAMAFYKLLMQIYESPDGSAIDDESARFWISAVGKL